MFFYQYDYKNIRTEKQNFNYQQLKTRNKSEKYYYY